MGPLLLGIDVGTSSVKAILADTDGKERHWASAAYKHSAPKPGWGEQDPDEWWHAVVAAVRELLENVPSASGRIAGIGVSGQGAAAVLLGSSGRPLRPAILWLDSRSSPQAEQMNERADRFVAISGKRPAAYNVEPKLIWVRSHEPDTWARLWKVTTTTGYINYRLTGRAVMNHSDAGILLSYDIKRRAWSSEFIDSLGFPRSAFCELAEGHEVIGGLSKEASEALGLPEGTPVVAGGEDTSSAGLAIGAAQAGDAFLSLGTACTLYMATGEAILDERLLTFPHVLPGISLTGGSMAAGGGAMRWIADVVRDREGLTSAQNEAQVFQALTREASQTPAGSGGLVFLPYLAGELQPVNDGAAKGAFLGLDYDTDRGAMVRAVMEGVAYAVRHNLAVLRETGETVRSLRAVGGPTRNELWCQILADVTGEALTVYAEEGGAPLGDAVLAAMGAGLIEDPSEMVARHVRIVRRHQPDERAKATYDRLFGVYTSLYPRLKDLFPLLASDG